MPSETTQIIIQYNQSTQKFESPLPGVIDSSQMICKYNPEKDTIEYTIPQITQNHYS